MKKKFITAIFIFSLLALAFQTSPYARRIRPFSSTPSTCQENEIGYNMTSHSLLICTNSGYTALTTGSSGSFAPANATFITQTANGSLTNEQALSALATGILKNTTTTGILSIAVAGTDYESPLTFTATDFDRTINTIAIDYTNAQAASGSLKGFLTSADWTTFNNKEFVLTFDSPLSRSTNTISCATCALTSGNLSQFASTTSAQLFGIISDESGIDGVLIKGNFTSLTLNDVLTWNGTDWINQAASGGGGALGTGNVSMTIANASSTGTTVNRLAKLTGAPSTAIVTSTSDTENAVGIVTSGAGTTGNATIALLGQVDCEFDNATTAGNYVVISAITAGKCHDNGSSFPNDKAAYGRVLTTNGASGTYSMELMTPDIAFQNAGNGKTRPCTTTAGALQYNNSGVFGCSGLAQTSATRINFADTTWTFGWGTGGGALTLTAIASGMQITNGDFVGSLRTAATPGVYISANVSSAGGVGLKNNQNISFASGSDATTSYDTGLSRNAAGTIEFNAGFPTSASSEADLRDSLSRHYYTGKTTIGNCLDSAGAAACGAATGGNIVIDAGATTVVVSTTQVKADSQIYVIQDSSLGTRLSITCNTTPAIPLVTARTAGTNFTITVPAAPTTNPACYSYFIVN